jgi:hypothetical protein
MTNSFFSTALAALAALLMLGFTPASHAQFGNASGNYETDLGQLHGSTESLRIIKDLCAEEFPEYKAKNEAAYAAWRAKSAPFLSEVDGHMTALIERETKGDRQKADAVRARLDQEFAVFKATQKRLFASDPVRARDRCGSYPALITVPAWDFEKSMAGHVAVMRKGPGKP